MPSRRRGCPEDGGEEYREYGHDGEDEGGAPPLAPPLPLNPRMGADLFEFLVQRVHERDRHRIVPNEAALDLRKGSTAVHRRGHADHLDPGRVSREPATANSV